MTKPTVIKLPAVQKRMTHAIPTYFAFARENSELGLAETQAGWHHFHRRHGDKLRQAKILARAPNGAPLVDPERFPEAAYYLITRGTLPPEMQTTGITTAAE